MSWIGIECGTDIHCFQMIHCNYFGDYSSSVTSMLTFLIWREMSRQLLDGHGIWYRYVCPPDFSFSGIIWTKFHFVEYIWPITWKTNAIPISMLTLAYNSKLCCVLVQPHRAASVAVVSSIICVQKLWKNSCLSTHCAFGLGPDLGLCRI